MFNLFTKKYPLGCLVDYSDPRDYLLESISEKVKLPDEFNLRNEMTPIILQRFGSCTSHSSTGVKEFFDSKEYRRNINLSERFTYHCIKKISGLWEIQGDYCFDKETEILTVEGWKKYNEINKKNEKIFSVNQETHELEIQKIEGFISFNYEGEMYHLKSVNMDLLVTPNHRCVYQRKYLKKSEKEEKWQIVSAKKLPSQNSIKFPLQTKGWSERKKPLYSDALVEFIGWFLTEGWIEKGYKDNLHLRIEQNEGKNADIIRDVLKRTGLRWNEHTNISGRKNPCIYFRIWAGDSKNLLTQFSFLKQKQFFVKFLLNLTFNQLVLLYRSLMAGDGHMDRNNPVFSQMKENFIDNFQVLVTLLGKSSRKFRNKTNQIFNIMIKISENSYRVRRKKEKYKGIVWCPTIKNGIIIIRRNGQTTITGQSRNAAKALVEYGSCLEKTYPNSGGKNWKEYVTQEPSKEVFKEAEKYKAKTYWRVNPDLESIKQAIFQYKCPVMLSMKWYNSYYKSFKNGHLPLPDTQRGGHAIACVGFTKDKLWLKNSHGTKWGDKGYCYIPFDEFQKHDIFDVWAVLDIEVPEILEGYVAQKYLGKISRFNKNELVKVKVDLNIRKEPAGEKIVVLKQNQILKVLNNDPIKKSNYDWIKIKVIK